MRSKWKLVAAGAAVALCVSAGSALAVKPAGDCLIVEPFLELDYLRVLYKGIGKYCNKGPDAAEAAKAGEKLARKVNKICEKYNDKIAKLDCVTEGDPDVTPPSPISEPCVEEADVEVILLGAEEECDGIATPP